MRDGLRALHLDPPIMLSAEDFQILTCNGLLCGSQGEMSFESFEKMIIQQIRAFIQRKAMAQIESLADGKKGGEQMSAIMFAVKNICGTVDDLVEKAEDSECSQQPFARSTIATQSLQAGNLQGGCCAGAFVSSAGATCKSEATNLLSSLRGSSQSMQAAIAASERNRLLSESILHRLRAAGLSPSKD